MNIRRATPSDIPVLVSLNRDVQSMHAAAFPWRYRRDTPLDEVASAFSAMLAAPTSYWLVAAIEKPVGFLSAEFRERDETWCLIAHRVCYLSAIVVSPEHHRRGIARALLSELRHEVMNRGVPQIELDVWQFNESARHAFTKLGFRPLMQKMNLPVQRPNKAPEPTTMAVTPRAPS